MKKAHESHLSLRFLKNRQPLSTASLSSWVDLAERDGFNAILPLIEKEGIDVVNRTLRQDVIDWLFLVGVTSWHRALLIGSDLGAGVAALKTLFQTVVIVEPNDLLHRLLHVRFKVDIATGQVQVNKQPFRDLGDVDFDFVWFTPIIGRGRGEIRLTSDVRAVLRNCSTRLATGGVLVSRFVRDRGLLRNLPLPAIRYEPGQGYTLREFETIFRSVYDNDRCLREYYWLTSRDNGRSSGARLQSYAAISYWIRGASRWFRFSGPLSDSGVAFVTKRVSSLMVAFERQGLAPKTKERASVLQYVLGAVAERYCETGDLAPLLYRSGSVRRDSHAIYLLINSTTRRPKYIARIAKGAEGESRLRHEHALYHTFRQSNGALQSLNPVYYCIPNESNSLSSSASDSDSGKYGGYSFSIERFVEGATGAALVKQPYTDISILEWLNWFQKESVGVRAGTFDHHALYNQMSVIERRILSTARDGFDDIEGGGLRPRIPVNVLKPLFSDLECRVNNMGLFHLPFTAVHGDFCQLNLLAYNGQGGGEINPGLRGASASADVALAKCSGMRIHVFDWEYLQVGGPLFDPWLYVIVFMYITIHGQVNRDVMRQFLTGTWKYSFRVEQCLAYYARISRCPVEALVNYLPLAVLELYYREINRAESNVGPVAVFEETVVSLALNRIAVWRYLDTLTERLHKDMQK